ncbi:MAG: PRD domain-containing protein [Clostridium sp.]|uniref:PRD domain-containing protein n=1 Tax=Clostridium TaxID=1485 RepID=UPI002152D66E|nr:PRD domain-containing protein [Clostridium sp. LY3-2]MCR6514016.1 PRD domain-containing protein [Clostridium sp. LY3-2]
MKISQILNNNVAVVKRGDNEVIVYSKGISFKKKAGQTITENEIEKTYVLDSNDMLEHFSYLLSNTDENQIVLTNEIIDFGEKLLNQKANSYLTLTLLDHINFALNRAKKNQFISSPLTWEVKRFYPKHFEIGLYALNKINKKYNIEFPEDEAVSIALHFVNLQENRNNIKVTIKAMESLRDIISIIQFSYSVNIDETSLNYMRLITHLQYFLYRINKGQIYNDNDVELNNQVKKLYSRAYECVNKIGIYIKEQYDTDISIDEETYLMLHIHRVTNRNEREE